MIAISGFGFFVVEEEIGEPVVNPGGSVSQESRVVLFESDDPDLTQEDANQKWLRVKTAIEAGDYRLVEVKKKEAGHPNDLYIYEVTLEDGTIVGHGTSEPLPEPEDD